MRINLINTPPNAFRNCNLKFDKFVSLLKQFMNGNIFYKIRVENLIWHIIVQRYV